MSVPTIEATQKDSLAEVCEFFNVNLNTKISPQSWQNAFLVNWQPSAPNLGFHVRNVAGDIVGAIGAIYSTQQLDNQAEHFCNISSWCVLDAYRNQSMRLVMSVISQKGYHYTDLTPSADVIRALKFLGFKPLETGTTIIFNTPSVQVSNRGTRVLTDKLEIEQSLPSGLAQIYTDHQGFSWINFIAVGKPGAFCLIAYKSDTVKHLPSAAIFYISDSELFNRYSASTKNWLLKRRFFTSTIETRFLNHSIPLSVERDTSQTRMFRSDSLASASITNLYSELFCMDL